MWGWGQSSESKGARLAFVSAEIPTHVGFRSCLDEGPRAMRDGESRSQNS